MASFLFYCPCKVRKLGLDAATHGPDGKSCFPYLLLMRIYDGTATCKHCGQVVRIAGKAPKADQRAGVTRRAIAKAWKAVDAGAWPGTLDGEAGGA